MNDHLLTIFDDIDPKEVIFWTGAGISMQSPTRLPNGAYLTELCMNAFMPQGTFDLVKGLFSLGRFKDSYGNSKALPRLELIIEDIVGVLGFRAFEYLSFMNIPRKYLNPYHHFFAKHITDGGVHITLNIDSGIETAMGNEAHVPTNDSPGLRSNFLKLHGSITDNTSYEDLGLILKNITFGLNDDIVRNISDALAASKILCFIGYGGTDSFDVTPFFEHLSDIFPTKSLEHLAAVWLSYRHDDNFEACNPRDVGNGAPIILNGLGKAGAKIYAFRGKGINLISYLQNAWKWNIQQSQLTNDYGWLNIFAQKSRDNPVSDDPKNLIAGQYMAALGAGEWAVFYCNSSRPPAYLSDKKEPNKGIFTSQINQWWRVYTNGLRDWGRYREAIKNIKQWLNLSNSPFDRFVCLSRLMGEYRIRGNFGKAFLTYVRTRHVLNRNNFLEEANPNDLFELAEFWITYLHLHRDLWKRFSKVRRILFYPWRYVIARAWIEAFLLNRKRPSPHDSTKLYELAEKIFEQSEYFIKKARVKTPRISDEIKKCIKISGITNFIETDSLLGDINYQRENNIDRRQPAGSMIDEIESNLLKAQAISDLPGIWKAQYRLSAEYLAERNFTMARRNSIIALRYMRKVQYSLYFRLDYTFRLWKILAKAKFSTIGGT